MQIGLAKTPTMHGGIASAEVGFTLCTLFLYYSSTYTYICLHCTSFDFYSLPLYIIVTHRKHTHWCTERGAVRGRAVCYFCVIWFLPCCGKLPSPWQWRALSRKKVPRVERGMTRAVDRGGEDANQERKFWAMHVALLLMAARKTPCIQISSIIGWQWSWAECMHVLMQICRLKPYLHTHTHTHAQSTQWSVWSQNDWFIHMHASGEK